MEKKTLPNLTDITKQAKSFVRGEKAHRAQKAASDAPATTGVGEQAGMGHVGSSSAVEAGSSETRKVLTVTFEDFHLGRRKASATNTGIEEIHVRYGVLYGDNVPLAVLMPNGYWKRTDGGLFSDFSVS